MHANRNDGRKFEVWRDGAWHPIRYRDVAYGDVIRIFEPDGRLYKQARWWNAGRCEADGTIPATSPIMAAEDFPGGPTDPDEYERNFARSPP